SPPALTSPHSSPTAIGATATPKRWARSTPKSSSSLPSKSSPPSPISASASTSPTTRCAALRNLSMISPPATPASPSRNSTAPASPPNPSAASFNIYNSTTGSTSVKPAIAPGSSPPPAKNSNSDLTPIIDMLPATLTQHSVLSAQH